MNSPWSEPLRSALRLLQQAVVVRAQRERDIVQGVQVRSQELERQHREAREALKAESVQAERDGQARDEDAVVEAEQQGKESKEALQLLLGNAKRKIVSDYDSAKHALETEFRDQRWANNTQYEADKKVAKEEWGQSQRRSRSILEQLVVHAKSGKKIWNRWHFLGELPKLDGQPVISDRSDLWGDLQRSLDAGAMALTRLENLPATRLINGVLPWLAIALLWLVASAAAAAVCEFALEQSWLYGVLAASLVVAPLGIGLVLARQARVRREAAQHWNTLLLSVAQAKALRPLHLEQARVAYHTRRADSKIRTKAQLKQLTRQTRQNLQDLRTQREEQLKGAQADHRASLAALVEETAGSLRDLDDRSARRHAELQESHLLKAKDLQQSHHRVRDEHNRKHAQEWTTLLREWKHACDHFTHVGRAVQERCAAAFPPWQAGNEAATALPWGIPFGRWKFSLQQIPEGTPHDPLLPRPQEPADGLPALLPFPERASLLLQAHGDGKAKAIQALQAILLRCWTGLPPGKVRCTIIDPVGRGENFSAFMHLADHDENLVHGRIWTETSHIEQRLSDLTGHMENVLQKHLRNQYQTLAEYNAQAGEVAEPFRFLVVADFPVNFSEDACRRLLSLASAGARCGIYTLILRDKEQPLPHHVDVAELERACVCVTWHKDQFRWDDDDFAPFPLELCAPPAPERCTQLLQAAGERAKRAGRVEVPFSSIAPPRDAWWTGDSRGGIDAPLGRTGATGKQLLSLGHGTSQHVLVAGKTGSGKSTLLHVLVTQIAMHYSPREVELYLIDFKKGVEFKSYAKVELPHARVIAVESEREFGLSVLQRLDGELTRRGDLYRQTGANDVASCRQHLDATTHDALPRIVLIVDEFQEFFVEDDKLAQEAALLLDRLVRQGRAFGVHIVLGSQTLGGAYTLARSTIDQMAVRIALQCSEADAHLILSRDNTEARLLSRPGEAIYNASHGMLEGNHLFQIVWLGDTLREDLLRQVHDLSRQRGEYHTPLVFEGSQPVLLSQNALLQKLWQQPSPVASSHPWQAWLGEAVAIKDPTAAVFRKQAGSNLLILGQDEKLAFGMFLSSLLSLAGWGRDVLGASEPFLHLVLGQAVDPEGEAMLALLAERLPLKIWPARELPTLLDQLVAESEQRGGGVGVAGPAFLCLYGLQRLRDLRKPDDDFGFARRGEEKSQPPHRQFTRLLKDGPPSGIFTLLWCDTLTNLQRAVDRQALREFDLRVLMQMSAADASALTDSPASSKLGPQRALLHAEDQGKSEKFRPYLPPDVAWLRGLLDQIDQAPRHVPAAAPPVAVPTEMTP